MPQMSVVALMLQKKKWFAASSLRICRNRWLALLTGLLAGSATAAPYIPASDDEVLIQLPAADEFARDATPLDSDASLSDAQRLSSARTLLELAYRSADEDAFGRAEALLAPWTRSASVAAIPLEAQYMLAVIRQHNHEFTGAVALLDSVLEQQPANAAARLQRAQINLVQGNYTAARADCVALQDYVAAAVAANCVAQVAAVTGLGHETMTRITALAAYQAAIAPADYAELILTLATTAHRLGLVEETDRYYRAALELGGNNAYATLQYSDFLLEQQRFESVMELVAKLPVSKLSLELQVKQLEALRATGNHEAYAIKHTELAETFTIARARSANFPYKEYARFLLLTAEQSREALQAALANWQYQKEPADLLLLARAAAAANDGPTLELARNWLRTTGLEDRRIEKLLGIDDTNATSRISEN